MKEFKKELKSLINKHSLENRSETADYILAEYLCNCLETFNQAVNARDIHDAKESRKAMTQLDKYFGVERKVTVKSDLKEEHNIVH